MIIPELLAPAGNFSIAEMAFDHGADAIYIGVGKFNLRAHSPNFIIEDLPELMNVALKRNKKVYIALNSMPDDCVLGEIQEMLFSMEKGGYLPNAFIISDPGILRLCKEIVPLVPLHLSTQTGTFNKGSLAFWKDQGISRAVLPRELTLKQISDFTSAAIMETEIFIHGAMCMSISGRCILGAYMGGRHPNHGDCPQPCRYKYRIAPLQDGSDKQGEWIDAEESENGLYLLNSRDLCTIDILPGILATGVHSLKIEGRNKSIHYVASVVKTYRAALDACLSDPDNYRVREEWRQSFESVEHRPYTTGFLAGEKMLQEVFSSKASSGSRVLGIVKGLLEGGIPVIDVKNSFSAGETLEVLPVQQSLSPYTITFTQLCDLAGNPVQRAPSSRLILAHGAQRLRVGDMFRVVTSKPSTV